MSELPAGWAIKRIGEVANIVRGVTYSKSDVLPGPMDQAVPLLRATNIQPGKLDYEDPVWLPAGIAKTSQMLLPGDLLVATSSGSLSIVGKNARVTLNRTATFGAFCTVIRPIQMDVRFLALWIESPTVRQLWSDKARGSNINNLKISDLADTEIPVPPLEVQQSIIETLEDHLSRLDKALSEVQFGRNLLSIERRALLHSAFVGELFEDTRAERVTQTLLGWDQKSLNEITLRNVQKIDPANLGRESFRYIEIGSFELDNGRIVAPTPIPSKGAPSRARQQIAHGDTVFSTVRPYMRKIGIVGSDLDGEIASTGFCVLRPDTNQVLPEYLALLSKSDVVLDQVLPLQRGASYPAVSDKDILSAQVFIPPLEVQKQIVESLEDHLSRLDKTSQTLDLVEHEANQLRRSLLHAAFTGQLTNEDSND